MPLILAGTTLLAGGENEVAAFDAATGNQTWSANLSMDGLTAWPWPMDGFSSGSGYRLHLQFRSEPKLPAKCLDALLKRTESRRIRCQCRGRDSPLVVR